MDMYHGARIEKFTASTTTTVATAGRKREVKQKTIKLVMVVGGVFLFDVVVPLLYVREMSAENVQLL